MTDTMYDTEADQDRVPTTPRYGGPTDMDHYCARCGDNLTGCALCAGEKHAVVRYRRQQ